MLAFPDDADKQNEFVVINACEELVKEIILKTVEYMEMCPCDKCISDASALVLNELKPLYVTTRKGELLSQVPQTVRDNYIDLTVKVVQALQLVKDSPRH